MSDTVKCIRIDVTALSVTLYKDSRLFNNNGKRKEKKRKKTEKKKKCVMSFKTM